MQRLLNEAKTAIHRHFGTCPRGVALYDDDDKEDERSSGRASRCEHMARGLDLGPRWAMQRAPVTHMSPTRPCWREPFGPHAVALASALQTESAGSYGRRTACPNSVVSPVSLTQGPRRRRRP